MLKRFLFLSILLVCAVVVTRSSQATADDKPCSKHPQLVGTCFTVRGRLSVYNGAPALRIWRIGTKRILGISEQRYAVPGYRNVPENIRAEIDQDKALFGDYLVCPFTKPKENEMQMVCIEKVTNLVVKKR
ncbi:MAG TPA: hypothetical protein VJ372_11980 [Pyrinomonadaceae bacterium]|jgi:hypothetical protein|nr:hypothetical protein [Pyrinomonadaceae bacterium]